MAIDYNSPAVISEARRKLAEMYAQSDTKQRTEFSQQLYPKSSPESARRSVRRLTRYTIAPGETANVTKSFRSFTTILQRNPKPQPFIPPAFAIDGKAQITAFAMFVVRMRYREGWEGLETYYSQINSAGFDTVSKVVESFVAQAELVYEEPEALRALGMDGYPGLEAIAFSQEGIDDLRAIPMYDSIEPPAEPVENFGIQMYNTKFDYEEIVVDGEKKSRRLPMRPPTATGRPFPNRPAGRRKEMIQFINRSYAQRKRGWDNQ